MNENKHTSRLVTVSMRADDAPGASGELRGTIFLPVGFLDRNQMWPLREAGKASNVSSSS